MDEFSRNRFGSWPENRIFVKNGWVFQKTEILEKKLLDGFSRICQELLWCPEKSLKFCLIFFIFEFSFFGWVFQIFLSIFVDRNVSKKEALLLKLECGVNIRLIVDSEYMFVTGSKVPILAQAGVKVIHDHTTGLFHHKFAIIDQKILITGSLNWTRQEW